MKSIGHSTKRTIAAVLYWTSKFWIVTLLVLLISLFITVSWDQMPGHTYCSGCCHCQDGCQCSNWEHWGGSGEAKEMKWFRTQSRGYLSHGEPSHELPQPSQRHSPLTVTTSEQVQQALLNNLQQRNRRRNFFWKYVPISQILFSAKRPLGSYYHCRQKRKMKSSSPLSTTVQQVLVNGSEIGALACSMACSFYK